MKHFDKSSILKIIQTWLTTSVFAAVVCYFLVRLSGLPTPGIFDFLFKALLLCGILGILVEFWKVSLPAIGILAVFVLFQAIAQIDIDLPFVSFHFWNDLISQVISTFRWIITDTASRGVMPAYFEQTILILICVISLLTNWILPIPILNMFLLIMPMFYLEQLAEDKKWIFMLLLGLFCVYCSYAYRQDSTNREQRPPVTFGLLLILMTFILQSLIPANVFFNQTLSQKINDIAPTEGGEITSFSLQELGFYPQGNLRVGGPITLTDEPYIKVNASSDSFYIRGAAYDSFDGNAWSLSQPQILQDYDFEENYYDILDSAQAKTFWFTDSSVRDKALEGNIVKSSVYQIVTEKATRIIFHSGKPVWLSRLADHVPSQATSTDWIDKYAIGGKFLYSENGMLVGTDTYEENGLVLIDTVTPTRSVIDFSAKENLFQNYLPARKAPKNELLEVIKENDPELYRIMYESYYDFPELIQALKDHFEQNYSYNLNVPRIENEKFINHFLRTKEGYCVYFATLWAQILSDLGYETRYVEGFLVPAAPQNPNNTDTMTLRTLTSNQAHAWVEVDVPGFGWYPIETTPTSHAEEIANLHDEAVAANTIDSQSSESMEESASSSDVESMEKKEEIEKADFEAQKHASSEGGFLWAIPVAVILFFLLFVLFGYDRFRQWRKRMSYSDYGNQEDRNKLARRIWMHTKRLLLHLGANVSDEDTIRTILQKAAELQSKGSSDLTPLSIELMEEILYGEKSVTDADMMALHQYYISLEWQLREKLPPARWFITDVLFVMGRPW